MHNPAEQIRFVENGSEAHRPASSRASIRIGAATEIPSVLREFGLDPSVVLTRAGVDPQLFDDAENLIPVITLGQVMRTCIAQTRCDHFGLLVGQRAGPSSLGAVGLFAQHATSVGDALERLIANFDLHDRGARPVLTVNGKVAVLEYVLCVSRIECAAQICDAAMAIGLNIMRSLCGPGWRPTEVLLSRRAPIDPRPFMTFFKAPVRFDEETAALVFSATWLKHSAPPTDPVMARILEERIEQLRCSFSLTFSDSVRQVLRTSVIRKSCSAEFVSSQFDITTRTMNRRLAAEGTSYKNLLDQVRFEVARHLIEATGMPFSQIAASLHFSEASSFTRAYRRWSGATPTEYRANHDGA